MKRRSALALLTLGTGCALQELKSKNSGTHLPKDERPNIMMAVADDWGWPYAGAYNDPLAWTPAFDQIAQQGVLFTNAFCASPSCTPSRCGMLTGQAIHRLEQAGNLWSTLDKKFPVYPKMLESEGYFIGCTGKSWGPGNLPPGGRTANPAGDEYPDFEAFLKAVPDGRPFCFWFGSNIPHRPYPAGAGRKSGMSLESVRVPGFLPDCPEVRSDILDYYHQVHEFDLQLRKLIYLLDSTPKGKNTLLVVVGDNGMPFPRAKANLYDAGSHITLAMRWPEKLKPGCVVEDLVSLTDLAPTFLESAAITPLEDMTGRSLLGLIGTERRESRDRVFIERERHACSRQGNLSYPSRAIRTRDFLYIRNLRPERNPLGDPAANGDWVEYGDIDMSPTKRHLLAHLDDPNIRPFFELACAPRPAEELYDLRNDPWQIKNVADQPQHANAKAELRKDLDAWMLRTEDPRATVDDDRWDLYPYYGKTKMKPRD